MFQSHKIVKNFLSISLLQAINYLIPLFILPYLVKVVGIANFGISNYILTIFIVFKIFIDYGYNISGVKDVSECKNQPDKLNIIFSKIFFTKIYLLLISLIILLIAILLIPILNKISTILLFSFLILIGQSLMPVWFYQAIEKSEILVVFSLFTRAIYLFLIFTYVQISEDYIFINLFLGFADILLSILSLAYIFWKYKIQIQLLSLPIFWHELKNNFVYARSNIYVTISLTMPFVTLGFFTNNLILGYYGIADKIIQVCRTSASILHSATFPRVIALYNQGFDVFKLFIQRLHVFLLVFYFFLFLACFVFPSFIIQVITNSNVIHQETILVLKILSVVPLIAALELLPTHLLLIQHKQKKYAQILFFASFFSGLISVVMSYFFNFIGAAIAYIFVELFILSWLIISNKIIISKIFSR